MGWGVKSAIYKNVTEIIQKFPYFFWKYWFFYKPDYSFVVVQYGLPMPVSLLRADNNLPPWRAGLKEVTLLYLWLICFSCNGCICNMLLQNILESFNVEKKKNISLNIWIPLHLFHSSNWDDVQTLCITFIVISFWWMMDVPKTIS